MVDGKLFLGDRGIVSRVGVNAYAVGAREAPLIARALIAVAPSSSPLGNLREGICGNGKRSEAIRRE